MRRGGGVGAVDDCSVSEGAGVVSGVVAVSCAGEFSIVSGGDGSCRALLYSRGHCFKMTELVKLYTGFPSYADITSILRVSWACS